MKNTKRLTTILSALAICASAHASIAPRYDTTIDASAQLTKHSLRMAQAGSQDFGFDFANLQGSLTTNDSVRWYYTDPDYSWQVVVTGAVEDADSVLVSVDPSHSNTNTAEAGSFPWRLEVQSVAGEIIATGCGSLTIPESPLSTGQPVLITTTNINTADYSISGTWPVSSIPTDIEATDATARAGVASNTTAIATHAAIVATSNTLGHIIVGDGLGITTGGVLSVTGGGGGSQTLAETLALGNTSGANDILLSANGLDQSRRIGFRVNDGISTSTSYLDSTIDGILRYGGSSLAFASDLSSYVRSDNTTYTQTVALAEEALPRSGGAMTGSITWGADNLIGPYDIIIVNTNGATYNTALQSESEVQAMVVYDKSNNTVGGMIVTAATGTRVGSDLGYIAIGYDGTITATQPISGVDGVADTDLATVGQLGGGGYQYIGNMSIFGVSTNITADLIGTEPVYRFDTANTESTYPVTVGLLAGVTNMTFEPICKAVTTTGTVVWAIGDSGIMTNHITAANTQTNWPAIEWAEDVDAQGNASMAVTVYSTSTAGPEAWLGGKLKGAQ